MAPIHRPAVHRIAGKSRHGRRAVVHLPFAIAVERVAVAANVPLVARVVLAVGVVLAELLLRKRRH